MRTMFASATGIAEPCRAPASDGPKVARAAVYAEELRIDGWLVQPALNLLTRPDASVRLRAQLMDLLLCLASRPGKVFAKDDLVAEVWEGRWIAQSGLSRCVAELRAALGDDAQRPRVIETITKRGYRLIAPVERLTIPEAHPAAAHQGVGQAPVEAQAPVDANGEVNANAEAHETSSMPLTLWQRLKLMARPAPASS